MLLLLAVQVVLLVRQLKSGTTCTSKVIVIFHAPFGIDKQMQAPQITDERNRLERLIALMPVGERRAEYERQLAVLKATSDTSSDSVIKGLRVQLETVTTEWHRLFDQLDAADDQNTPNFDARFAEWEQVDEEYKRLCDQIDLLERSGFVRQSSLQTATGQ